MAKLEMYEAEFWKAVDANELSTVSALLERTPELVHARYRGYAWRPGLIWDNEIGREAGAAADFSFSNTALHTAAVNGRAELAEMLLNNEADVNAIGFEDNKGLTPAIVLATWEGGIETMCVLLDNNADPNIPASAESALYTAIEHEAEDRMNLLLERGARHDVFTAAMVGDVDLVEHLIRAYPPLLKARSLKRNRTPAEEAAFFKQHEVVKAIQELDRQ